MYDVAYDECDHVLLYLAAELGFGHCTERIRLPIRLGAKMQDLHKPKATESGQGVLLNRFHFVRACILLYTAKAFGRPN